MQRWIVLTVKTRPARAAAGWHCNNKHSECSATRLIQSHGSDGGGEEGRAGARRCPDSNNRNQREAPGALQIRGAQPGAGFPRRQRRRDAAQRRPCSASPSPEAQLTEAGLPSGMETPSTVLNSFHSPPSLRSTINTCVSDGRTGRGSGSRSVGKVRKRCPNGGQRSR